MSTALTIIIWSLIIIGVIITYMLVSIHKERADYPTGWEWTEHSSQSDEDTTQSEEDELWKRL